MATQPNDADAARAIRQRTAEICEKNIGSANRATDRVFLWLLLVQWAFAIVLAVWLSPYAWEGKTQAIHVHVKIAVVFGGLINALPIALILLRPGRVGTRCVVGVVQMLWSAVLIHLTGGRIETHFHVFGSLAFLAFYKDWRVIVVATLTVAADHYLRGLAWPESVYGTLTPEWWRFLEHSGWVVFEDVVLLMGCQRGMTLYRELAEREARLEAAHSNVERQVIERTRQLEAEIEERGKQAEELRRSRSAAEAVSRAKSEFLANMSHEIRTPMNGVLGFTNLLLDTRLDEEQRDHVRTIRQSGEALLNVINDILDFSKVEAGKLAIERVPFSVREAAEEVAELLAPQADAKGLEIALQTDSRLPATIEGDPGRLRQVLLNLVGNAIKFTRQGHVMIQIDVLPPAAPSDCGSLHCTVSDTGVGIPPEKQSLLFQEFTQADASTTREFGGTGLGLAISKRLIGLMGGQIGFSSEKDRGSRFWFTLPLPADAAAAPACAPPPNPGDMRILIVDDLEINRRLLSEQLKGWGIAHECAESGERTLDMLRTACTGSRPFDIALVDFLMPGMDGLELGRRIKADPHLNATALVMLTSGSQRSAAPTFLAAGFSVFLMKPVVRPAQLLNAITKAMCSRPSHARAAGLAGDVDAGARSGAFKALVPGIEREERTRAQPQTAPRQVHTRVLVAEDNAVNQKLVKHILEKLGCRVDIAADGREALAMAAKLQYDLIFMDCSMPEMDGYTATAELRRKEAGGRRIPVVAFTANALAEDRARCLAAGMDDYLSKPVRIEGVQAALRRWAPPLQSAQNARTVEKARSNLV